MVKPETIPINDRIDITSAAKRQYRISAEHGEVSFDDPLHYEGPLDLALMHSFGPEGLTNRNCEPFEKLADALWERHEPHGLTPVLMITPKITGKDVITTAFDSFIAAVDATNPTFVSRLTPQAGAHPTDFPKSIGEGLAFRTITLKAQAARADGHILADGGHYEQSSGHPMGYSRVVPEIPLYVHSSPVVQDISGKPPDFKPHDEPIEYLRGDDSVVHVGWSKLTEIITGAYDYSNRAEVHESGNEYAFCQLAINAASMLKDCGFSLEEIKQKSFRLARHIQKMQTIGRILSTLEQTSALAA